MTPVLHRIPAGIFGDEAGELRRWDGERWGDGVGEDLVPVDVRQQRLDAQVAAFERAGYRVAHREAGRAVLVRERRRGLRAIVGRGTPSVGAHVVITIDRAGSVRFTA